MKRTWMVLLAGAVLLIVVILLVVAVRATKPKVYFIDRTEINPRPPRVKLELEDDRLEDKNPSFDAALVDSRPLGDWEINKSAVVIRLECPDILQDTGAELLVLRPSYRDAIRVARESGYDLLPSANLIDGAAKQIDDGLYAAIDLACFRGELGTGPSAPGLVQTLFDRLPQGSPARPFLAAAVGLTGKVVDLEQAEAALKEEFLNQFERDKERSKPIGFYTWTPELEEVWRFYRFLQYEFDELSGLAIPQSIAQVLETDQDLLSQYQSFNRFYGRLTNPLISLPVDALIGQDAALSELARRHGARRETVCVFPPSTSRETELFDRLFVLGLPPDIDLMGELIRRIRVGEVDLAPQDADGWYQYQIHALETMLLPGKGQEADKLQLMATYKKRLVEAFEALVTKRRETHVRQLGVPETCTEAEPLSHVAPRLRVEPCATFYLRTARAYGFLQNFLLATCGEDTLRDLHGLRKDGMRALNLLDELEAIRQRFCGFYLIACEDIGMPPQFLDGEPVDQEAAKRQALAWLEDFKTDPDLACDTRVAVPIFREPLRGKTRLWATLGVRLARLDASYARPPKVRPMDIGVDWEDVESYKLARSRYVIPVDEFGEFEIDGSNALTRAELRAICDQHKTRDAILEALVRQ
jgi:hypothetical protein